MRVCIDITGPATACALAVMMAVVGATPSPTRWVAASSGPPYALGSGAVSPLEANFTYGIDGATCLANGQVANSVTLNGTATGGVPPYTFSWTLPTGSGTGPEVITTTTTGGNNSVTLRVADSANHTATHYEVLPVEVPACTTYSNFGNDVRALEISLVILLGAGCIGIVIGLWRRRARRRPPRPALDAANSVP